MKLPTKEAAKLFADGFDKGREYGLRSAEKKVKKVKQRNYYMHTLDRQPAYYEPGRQVVFAGRSGVMRLCTTLAQLRKQQTASRLWRRSNGMQDSANEYGYVLIRGSALGKPAPQEGK